MSAPLHVDAQLGRLAMSIHPALTWEPNVILRRGLESLGAKYAGASAVLSLGRTAPALEGSRAVQQSDGNPFSFCQRLAPPL